MVGQRLHPDDLIGTLLRSAERWTALTFPAIAEKEEYIPIWTGPVASAPRRRSPASGTTERASILRRLRISGSRNLCGSISAKSNPAGRLLDQTGPDSIL